MTQRIIKECDCKTARLHDCMTARLPTFAKATVANARLQDNISNFYNFKGLTH